MNRRFHRTSETEFPSVGPQRPTCRMANPKLMTDADPLRPAFTKRHERTRTRRKPTSPSAAIQTGGTTAQNAKFIQKFGCWEARVKQPHNIKGEGNGLHPDFWMHPIPEDIGSYKFLSLDNDNKVADWQKNPWMVQYVRVWRLDPRSPSVTAPGQGGALPSPSSPRSPPTRENR